MSRIQQQPHDIGALLANLFNQSSIGDHLKKTAVAAATTTTTRSGNDSSGIRTPIKPSRAPGITGGGGGGGGGAGSSANANAGAASGTAAATSTAGGSGSATLNRNNPFFGDMHDYDYGFGDAEDHYLPPDNDWVDEWELSLAEARRLQREFDEEDTLLRMQMEELQLLHDPVPDVVPIAPGVAGPSAAPLQPAPPQPAVPAPATARATPPSLPAAPALGGGGGRGVQAGPSTAAQVTVPLVSTQPPPPLPPKTPMAAAAAGPSTAARPPSPEWVHPTWWHWAFQSPPFLSPVQTPPRSPSPPPLPTFECAICKDDVYLFEATEIGACGHLYCKGCLKDYVLARIEERRYPVLCPTCWSEEKEEPVVVEDTLVRMLGIPNEKYAIWEELQLVEHSVIVKCRFCKEEAHVDRGEYQAAKIITCPVAPCKYKWCKLCEQTVQPFGPEHSCDGTNEFNHLFQQEGWKRCPGCEIPVHKFEGCNHMICTSPSCNSHFCYICGVLMIKTDGSKNGVDAAVERHYSGACILFEVPPE